jgi:hypothetical protein
MYRGFRYAEFLCRVAHGGAAFRNVSAERRGSFLLPYLHFFSPSKMFTLNVYAVCAQHMIKKQNENAEAQSYSQNRQYRRVCFEFFHEIV